MTFSREGDLLRLTGSGRVPPLEVQQVFREALAHPQLPPKLRVLLDLRSVPALDLSQEDLRALRSIAADAHLPLLGARIAWVATADVVFGIGCMFRAAASALPLEVEVFRKVSEADAWFGEESAERRSGH